MNSIILRGDLTCFYMYLYVQYISGHEKICTNDYFASTLFSAKYNNFSVSFLFRKEKN